MNGACFKAYDIRGRIGEELDEDMAWRIGRAMSEQLRASRIVVGADMRLSSPALCNALSEGILSGADVIDIGLSGTEEVYFATVTIKQTVACRSPPATTPPTTTG